jgi:hypothetical protein
MKTYGGVEVQLHALITWALDGDLPVPAALLPGKDPRYPLHRRLDGPQSPYGRGGEEKNFCPCRELNPGRPARNLVTILTELPKKNVKSMDLRKVL